MLDYQVLPTTRLHVDGTYQRFISRAGAARIERMAKDWRWDLVGAIHVNHRVDDTFIVVDGQHRYLAATKADVPSLPCIVHEGLNAFTEAQLFVDLNMGQVKLRANDAFRAKLFAGDPVAVGVTNTVMDAGLHISIDHQGDLTHLQNVGTLSFIYEQVGPTVLRQGLDVLRDAWPLDPLRWHRLLVAGVPAFIWLYQSHPDFKVERLARSLSLLPPREILNRMTAGGVESLGTRSSHDPTLKSTMRLLRPVGRRILLDQYNYRLRTNLLPDLTMSEMLAITRDGTYPW